MSSVSHPAPAPGGSAAIDPRCVIWSDPAVAADPCALTGKPLIVCLHGWSSNARDISAVTGRLGDAVFAAPDAPEASPTDYPGRQWFTLPIGPDGKMRGTGDPDDGQDDEEDIAARELISTGSTNAACAVLAWLDELMAAGAEPSSVSLMGFSQGGIVAMQMLREAPGRFACAALAAGLVSPLPRPGDAELRERRPEVFWGRGERDEVIPPVAITSTSAWLREHATVQLHTEPDLGHEFSDEMLRAMREFYAARI